MSIIEIIGEVVESTGLKSGEQINYLFGDSIYINNCLSIMDKANATKGLKMPMIALYVPFTEDRSNKNLFTSSNVTILFAVETLSSYTNEERLQNSFIEQLRPMYESFFECLKSHKMTEISYDGVVPHSYKEIYSFGSRGAMDSDKNEFSVLIDATEVSNIKINVKKEQCYGNRY